METRKFSNKWKEYSLYELANWKNGLAFKKIDFSDSGHPIIKIAELKNGITSQTSYTRQKYSEDVYLKNDDLIFSWSGNPETSIDAFLYRLPEGYLNQHSFKVTPIKAINKYFLYYILKYLKPIFKQIATDKQTTGLGHVTVSNLKELKVKVPSLEIQDKFLKLIKSIDDKIELNNQTNYHLFQYSKNYFKKFMQELEETEVVELNEICNISAGGDKPQMVSNIKFENSVPIYSNGITDEGLYGYTNKAKINDKAVTVSARGTIGFTCLRLEPFYPIVRLISLVPKDQRVCAEFIYLSILDMNIISTGTTQQQLTVPSFKQEKITIPKNVVDIERFKAVIEPIYIKIKLNQKQNEILEELRDTLLPKLMNGEIDLDKIEI